MAVEKVLSYVLLVLVLVGALNWGLHAFGLNLVTYVGDGLSSLLSSPENVSENSHLFQKVVYVLVALAAVGVIVQMTVRKTVVVKDRDEE
jgi:uncharacterized membrane protein YuzA (DUF378 family)